MKLSDPVGVLTLNVIDQRNSMVGNLLDDKFHRESILNYKCQRSAVDVEVGVEIWFIASSCNKPKRSITANRNIFKGSADNFHMIICITSLHIKFFFP